MRKSGGLGRSATTGAGAEVRAVGGSAYRKENRAVATAGGACRPGNVSRRRVAAPRAGPNGRETLGKLSRAPSASDERALRQTLLDERGESYQNVRSRVNRSRIGGRFRDFYRAFKPDVSLLFVEFAEVEAFGWLSLRPVRDGRVAGSQARGFAAACKAFFSAFSRAAQPEPRWRLGKPAKSRSHAACAGLEVASADREGGCGAEPRAG